MAPTKNIQVPAQTAQAVDYIEFKNRITNTVINKITEMQKGGISMPKGYSPQNQIMLAFLKLSAMEDPKTHQPILSIVTPQSVANSLLRMCVKGLSLDKSQCAFIRYGNELQMQPQYQGIIAMAKRYGAGDPQAQVIYQDDIFEFGINPKTGKKEVTRHEQKLANIDNSKIIGAWCLVPYAEHPDWDPKIEVMTMAEIRQAWQQGATKGESGAHRNFTQEMAKKTVISRACKLFVETSSDAGIYDDAQDDAEFQAQPQAAPIPLKEADLEAIPPLNAETIGEAVEAPETAPESTKAPAAAPAPAPAPAPTQEQPFSDSMFDPDYKG